jgi:hypothetical protein
MILFFLKIFKITIYLEYRIIFKIKYYIYRMTLKKKTLVNIINMLKVIQKKTNKLNKLKVNIVNTLKMILKVKKKKMN